MLPQIQNSSGLPVGMVVKNLPAIARDTKEAGLIPGLGRSPGEENGNPPLFPCLENSMGRAGWQAVCSPQDCKMSNTTEHTPTGIEYKLHRTKGFPGGSVGKESACDAGDTGDTGLIPGSGRSSRGGNDNPLQYSSLKQSHG